MGSLDQILMEIYGVIAIIFAFFRAIGTEITVTGVAGIVVVASVSLVMVLNLLRMMGWLATTWWFNGLVIASGVATLLALVVRFFARRALPRLPRDYQSKKHFGDR